MKVILNPNNFAYIKKDADKYIIYCDIVNVKNENVNVIQAEAITFTYKPYPAEIKKAITEYYNTKISNKLTNGFVWNGMNIPLTEHDQLNYKTACDLAVQTQGKSLPVTFKFKSNGNSTYYAFSDVDTILNFWSAAAKHINECLVEGWKAKESINLDNYKL